MSKTIKNKVNTLNPKKMRKYFGSVRETVPIPNLIAVQKNSCDKFLREGLDAVFSSIFPIEDQKAVLQYVRHELEEPKYTPEECLTRDTNYASLLLVYLRLIVWDIDEETGERSVLNIKEQKVYMGELPLMTERGTFIFNGAERVLVSQKHRAPGSFFYDDEGKKHPSGKKQYFARIMPYRGSWIDIESDAKDVIYFRIDRKRKLPVTTLLRALGYNKEQILHTFYNTFSLSYKNGKWITKFNLEHFRGLKVYYDIIDAQNGEIIIKADTKITPRVAKKLSEIEGHRDFIVPHEELLTYFIGGSIETEEGFLIAEAGDAISEELLDLIEKNNIDEILCLEIDFIKTTPCIRHTLILDKNQSKEEALADIYRVIRPGEPSTIEAAENVFKSLFFDKDRYDLSAIGRMRINMKHQINLPESHSILDSQDIIAVIKHLLDIKNGLAQVDDIDNLANQRVRSFDELVENQLRLGLVRMSRAIVDRMAVIDINTAMPHELINANALMSMVRDFFGRSQLSQFMDQTNPLSEVTHKRRISAFGPGGVSRERAGLDIRDVHPTQYGMICPIETPEGHNIGLINSLACYANIDKYGFIETPYHKITDGVISEEFVYLSAIESSRYAIAQAKELRDKDNRLVNQYVTCRQNGEIVIVMRDKVEYIDVSPKQLVSISASLIPFLEHDDANRALMGSNMQRQAVPLLKPEAPLIGTGMEAVVARDSGAVVLAKRSGYVSQVDSKRIVVRVDDSEDLDNTGIDIYTLTKFKKSNQGTCISQRPIVKVGHRVERGDVIADNSSTDMGELALGCNLLVAFMPWRGSNFQDSILLSERISREDIYTSIHITKYEVQARDTRLGPEEITRDIQAPEEALRHLDEFGIVRIGAEVKAGDILVGKATPRGETVASPEEKLLRAVFGEKSADFKDSSLRVPSGVSGTVISTHCFTRRGVEKDERALAEERVEIELLELDRDEEISFLHSFVKDKVFKTLEGMTVTVGNRHIKTGTVISAPLLENVPLKHFWTISVEDPRAMQEISKIKDLYEACSMKIEANFKSKVSKVQSGDSLPQGALKLIKVYIATKLKIEPGDKMAGRHGNKGVVSKIMPIEDMPFLEDGTAVDIVLNPLGVPSRMNVGQILETHLGWASAGMGKQIAKAMQVARQEASYDRVRELLYEIYGEMGEETSANEARKELEIMTDTEIEELAENLQRGVPIASPVFDGVSKEDLETLLEKAGLDRSGQVKLIDGITGKFFDKPVTLGYIYMLKLDHLVSDKIHSRSTGPYSLVTQQPLGGKSHFGGQRLGEMEAWALEAFGAAYTLQEFFTNKSDDVYGRVKMYEAIVQGSSSFTIGIPESFNVIVAELRSLCLNVEMREGFGDQKDYSTESNDS